MQSVPIAPHCVHVAGLEASYNHGEHTTGKALCDGHCSNKNIVMGE